MTGPDAVITSSANKLIVRAAPSKLTAIKTLIDELDIPQRMVLVSVRQLEGNRRYRNDTSTKGIMALEVPAKDPNTSTHNRQYFTKSSGNMLNQVQTIEGRAAFIYLNRSVPYDRQQYFLKGRHTGFFRERDDRVVSNGFYVTPRIRGEVVELEVSSLQQRPNNDELETLEGREVSTIVNGRLGEWIGLGSGNKGMKHANQPITSRILRSRTNDFLIQIKAEMIH
ncbi:MAG: hypothetical protein GY807_08940 [Gammaproteobacteria bacterium]|nr:hypothetical protein [Gammaproteobacteria bacterium]